MTAALPLTISEADLQRTVIDLAARTGWRVHHARPAQVRPGRWATPLSGHPGAPDLLLARGGEVLCVELKRHGGRVTPGQREWLAALGAHGRLWTPKSWGEIVGTLR